MTNAPIAPPYQLGSTSHGTMLANSNDVYMGQAFLRYGECCEIEIRLLLSLLKVPGMVIEVGANMGFTPFRWLPNWHGKVDRC
jgi:hypothetical protein